MKEIPERIVLFDGVCNLCTGSVKFILKRDRAERFRYASLQSATGKAILQTIDAGDDTTSVIYIRNGKAYFRSNAVLEVLKDMKRGWQLLYAFKIIPLYLRDAIYKWVAKRRYNLFGIKDTCYIPERPVKHLFYED